MRWFQSYNVGQLVEIAAVEGWARGIVIGRTKSGLPRVKPLAWSSGHLVIDRKTDIRMVQPRIERGRRVA